MPELPEVQTTVNGLRSQIKGLVIKDTWTNYGSNYFKGSGTIKDPAYYKFFRKQVIGNKIISAERRAKNILINLSGNRTILIHMKMTGHLLYGKYKFGQKNKKDPWEPIEPESLKHGINRHVRFIITFNNGRHLALSDLRRFAKITVIETDKINSSIHLADLGPEPLEKEFTLHAFRKRLETRQNAPIKQVLTDQSVISGIGNIYADESLWHAKIHPLQKAGTLTTPRLAVLFRTIKKLLSKGIKLGGDSMSDYRNIKGDKGKFQEHHRAYRKTGEKCSKPGCGGKIVRITVGGRGTHFCDIHQKIN